MAASARPASPPPAAPRQSDQAFARIKQEIILCRLAPGARFSEAQLSAELGLNRAAARAALIRLADLGLVEPMARHGFVVAPISLQSVRDLFELRLLVEPPATAMAVGRISAAELAALNRAPQAARSGAERLAFVEANRAFHRAIAAATGNRRLFRLLESIADDMQRLVQFGLFGPGGIADDDTEREVADGQHKALIAAFAAGDRAEAERIARAHIEHARELVLRRLLEGRGPALL